MCLVGCGDGHPKRVPISGKVLIDGEPVPYGTIMFVPEGFRPAAGELGEDGSFKLTCFDGGDGVVLGTHKIQVSASDLTSGKAVWLAPQKYSNFRTSGLTHTVTEADDNVVINLTWEGEKRRRR